MRSRRKLVCSHASRKSATAPATTASPPSATATEIIPSSVTSPIARHVTPAAAYAFATWSTSSGAISRMIASSSANIAARSESSESSSPDPRGSVALTPTSGRGNAISASATTTPPSLTSCPALIFRSLTRSCVVSHAALKYARSSMSGATSPIWSYACASAEPPSRRRPAALANSTRKSFPEPGSFRSGVTVLVMSGTVTYPDMTTEPGALTTSPSARAAMDSESLPPSIATSRSFIASHNATHASNMCAPSPGNFAAYIQFPEYLTSLSPDVHAKTRFVSDSPRDMRAIAPGFTMPLIGCSPMHVAPPVVPKCVWEMTATSAMGICSGPTHCCCATRPVTLRSTFVVRKRLEQTLGRRSTRSSAAIAVVPAGSATGSFSNVARFKSYVFLGMSPSTFSRSRSSGVGDPGGAVGSTSFTRPLPSMLPRTLNGHRSRAQMRSITGSDSGAINIAEFS
mmetsp:Transcript_174349/g.424162  ORF Transcript_174349/g.424162 Transcript_174349/m.424162 type:complete len:457 (+) Transcript_174349:176-1546(+)